MDLPVNETDIINNAVNSNGLLSKRTILQNHPWVTDVDEELARIDEEKKAAMVSNLLVVLCADEPAQPVINSGTLNH